MAVIFKAKFENVDTGKEINYYVTADEPNEWEKALKCARDYEQQSDALLLIKLEYLGLTINA